MKNGKEAKPPKAAKGGKRVKVQDLDAKAHVTGGGIGPVLPAAEVFAPTAARNTLEVM